MRLIDANELDGKLEALVQKYTAQGRPEVAKDYSFVKTILLTARTVDAVEVVHGHWCWEGRFRACSECGSYVEFTETLGASHWKYCPYCGAKMGAEAAKQPEERA